MQACVEVNKRQILALLGREGFSRRTHAGHPIQLFVRPSSEEEARMNVRYRVELSQTERDQMTALLSGGKHAARGLKRAQILLAADGGASDEEIARSVGVGGSTVYRTKRRFVLGNLEAALNEEPCPGGAASSRAKTKPCWWRRPVRNLRRAGPVGRWSCWPASLLSSPRTRASRVRRYAGAWPKMTLSPGARTCGASHRSMPNTSPAWRTCSISTRKSPTPKAPSGLLRREPGPAHRRSATTNPSQARSAGALRLRV